MRFVSLCSAAAVMGLGFAAFASDALRLPERKAGLWELSQTMDEGLGVRDHGVLTICVDAEMEHNTVTASLHEHKERCSKYDISKQGDATIVDMACQFASRHVVSRTEMTGDFKTAMQVKIESTTSGEHNGQSVAVKRTITQTGKYVGESCGDLTGGEARGPDGNKVMVQ